MKTLKTKTQFIEAKSYVKESRKYIYAAIIIFALFGILGFTYRNQLGFIESILEELFMKTEGLNTLELIMFILQNNISSAFLAITFGVFLGIFPLFNSISNGVVIGYVLGIVKDATGTTQFWRLLPHGIFELPAIFIALGLGIKFGLEHLKNHTKYYWKNSKLILILPIILAAISTILNYNSIQKTFEEIQLQLGTATLVIASLIQSLILYTVILFILTAIFNKKLRKIQEKTFKHNICQSANTLLLLIIPLLIIAAIVEGLLIRFLG